MYFLEIFRKLSWILLALVFRMIDNETYALRNDTSQNFHTHRVRYLPNVHYIL